MIEPDIDAQVGHSPEAEALFDLIFATARAFFRLRAAGAKTGAVTSWGGGLFGLLHGLAEAGPQTVPQIARARPVSRQRIQKLVDEMAADELVAFMENPAHKRSKLVHLTTKGEVAYRNMRSMLLKVCETVAADMDGEEVATASAVLNELAGKLAKF